MKAVIQRVKKASISVDNNVVNSIKEGYLILLGISKDDTSEDAVKLSNKVLNLRILDDENGVMNNSILKNGGEILSISQFTLQANTKKGNRPSYVNAMSGEEAIKLYKEFNSLLNKKIKTKDGVFGADMDISLINDGPVTIILDTKK